MKYKHHTYRRRKPSFLLVLPFFMLLLMTVSTNAQTTPVCERTVKADVVALDQVIVYNRLGTINPGGMIYALKQDVVAIDPLKGLVAGNVRLRSDKRPRPIVLRMNNGDCLRVSFTNLLSATPKSHNDPEDPLSDQPATRSAGVHVNGMELVGSIASDGSNVGVNPPSLVGPGGSTVYTYAATREGNNLMYSTAATTGGEGNGGTLSEGLFGSVNVEVRGAEWYRSQLTAAEMALATVKNADGTPKVTPAGQPILNYDAVYPAGHPRAGKPIIKMLNVDTIVHTDLNAIITGPNKGRFPAGTYRPNATEPDRDRPFREFTVIYHDEIQDIQAFPQFRDPILKHTLHSVEDKFAINYGVAGVGAEILANRLGVGPMFNCTECKFEEFFLSSWTIGDPAQIVDKPANTTDSAGNLILGRKATKVLYPDDPSNVHHSYIGDPVKMRVVHAGPKEHHIHHLHAHQWLQTPDDDNSTYLDSQALGPGYAFTTEIVHGGTGNRNQVVGDSIFHCHFYPHFAEGMWELWRAHDVFESGTVLNSSGIPVAGARALPDGEILAGTPTPAIVPLLTLAMAPMPTATVPGYPFFNPAVAGHRPPHPPLDTIDDGGLPRHIITGGTTHHVETRLDFSKELLTAVAQAIPETGTAAEIAEMQYHEVRLHPSFKPDGTAANFILNGLPRKPGAPFADPCISDTGTAIGNPRTYKAAAFQLDIKLNKAGWHFPQSRILSLWADVAPTQAGTKPPEPFFFRANTNDCITYYHTNLVPGVYEQDDFQVRTPTDIIGQHIHLVKFDVTSSDGSGNGFNYEDGTFSPDEVRERVIAIRKQNSCIGLESGDIRDGTFTCPVGKFHPFFNIKYAQTTIQRWFADDTLNNNGKDRTLRTVFTHDHFGPSTHQQAGLYAGLVVEPKDSQWKSAVDGSAMGGGTITTPPVRPDGGPTSWQANIVTATAGDSYREFVLEFQDLQLAYDQGSITTPNPAKDKGWRDGNHAVNPTVFQEFGQIRPRLVSTGNVTPITGTQSVNYYNEPIAWRLGQFKDLSYAFDNQTALEVNPNFPNVQNPNPDPLTPLMRAYQGDKVQIRTLVGAHVFAHQFNFAGPQWFAEPSWKNSGYRSNQPMGLSEHFELLFKVPSSSAPNPVAPATSVRKCPDGMSTANCIDYFYSPSFDETGIAQGLWGLFRSYDPTVKATSLAELPNNRIASTNNVSYATCPANLTATQKRVFNITAVTAQKALSGQAQSPGELVFNSRVMPGTSASPGNISTLLGVMYVRSEDLDSNGVLKPGVKIEPLVLRANAGDCIDVNLTNKIDPSSKVFSHNFNWPAPFNVTVPSTSATDGTAQVPAYQSKMSAYVGLHPQLLSYDAATSFGMNVGWNSKGYADQFANFNETVKYRWYAGTIARGSNGTLAYTPVEFGSLNLLPSDPMFQHPNGVFGQMIIEPQGSKYQCGDPDALGSCDGGSTVSRTSATVTLATGGRFREFSIMLSDALITSATQPINAINYSTEPANHRFAKAGTDVSCMTSNTLADPTNPTVQIGEPQTPIFKANPGDQVRFRMTHPLGTGNSEVFTIHGHAWQKNPYQNNSTIISPNNNLSQWIGSRDNHGSTDHFDLVIPSAGGTGKRPGDYLYTTYLPADASAGSWGIFRVATNFNLPTPTGVCTPGAATEAAPASRGPVQNLIDRFRRQPLNPSSKP